MLVAAPLGALPGMLSAHGAAPHDLPPPFTVARAFTEWQIDPVVVVLLLAVAGLYLGGVRRLHARGDSWSRGRTISFVGLGLGSIAIATLSSLGVYDDTLFSVHMVQHMVLSMVAPIFMALGAPVTLALRALGHGRPRQVLVSVLHSRVAAVLGSPLVAAPIFVGTMFVLYFTPLYQATLEHDWLHELTHVHFVFAGCLFFWPILGLDPVPGRLHPLMRILVLFVTLPMHAWLGISIMGGHQIIAGHYYAELGRTWGPSLASDQSIGGGLLWASGDLISILMFIVIFLQWSHADEREARRTDRRMDRAEAEHREDDELAAYNAYLADLAAGRARRFAR